MIVNSFSFRGKEYTVKIPEIGVDNELVPFFEVLDNDTQLIRRYEVTQYQPDFRNKFIDIVYEDVLISNNVRVSGTARLSRCRVSNVNEFNYFYMISLNGVGVSKELINGVLFNEIKARCFTALGEFYQPISLDVVNTTNSITVTPVDFDGEEVLEFSIDGGTTWQESGIFLSLEEGEYSIKAKYVDSVLRTFPTTSEIIFTETIEVKL